MLWVYIEYRLSKLTKLEDIDFGYSTFSGRDLVLRDFRISIAYYFFTLLSFFGIGNIASINSFDVTSAYCFTTFLNPVFFAPLIFLKTILPMLMCTCALYAIHVSLSVPLKGLFTLILFISDAMAIHFFFMIKDEGSWLDIGTSISHYVIVMTYVLVLCLFISLAKLLMSTQFKLSLSSSKGLKKKL